MADSCGSYPLTKVDDANVTLRLGGTPERSLFMAASITAGWQGTLAPGRGGLGVNASAANGVPLFTSGAVSFVPLPGGGSGSGDVTGPTGAVADNIATYNGTTGKIVKDGGSKIADLAALTQVVRYDSAQSLTATQQKQARSNIAVNDGNVLINGDFRVNQVGYVSAAVLAAGVYGHDQWKAGASGGDYSFTQLKSSTQITIAAGKSLIQPIEDANAVGGSYILSWTGTAQARAGVNTLTPSGAYAVSPLLITGQTAGTVMSVEFNTGTLGAVKLESGSTATPFIMRPYDQELLTCQRYYEKQTGVIGSGLCYSTTGAVINTFFREKRASPTFLVVNLTSFSAAIATSAIVPLTNMGAAVFPTPRSHQFTIAVASGLVAGNSTYLVSTPDAAYLTYDARL